MISPLVSERRPGPTARTSPCWGFSLAVSGMTRPDAVVASDSLARTTMRSSRGCRFMDVAPPLARGSDTCVSTLRQRVLTIGAARAQSQLVLGGAQAQVRVGAGVEAGGAVELEAPEPGGGDH